MASFSNAAIEEAVASARSHYQGGLTGLSATESLAADDGHLLTLAECIELEIKDGKVSLELPLGLGAASIPVPIKFNAKIASICLHICTTFGIPTGVRVTVSIGGMTIVTKTFGKC
jgi:hypothetical protein